MLRAASARTPAHLWIVGILSLLLNCFGAFDYTMTRMHNWIISLKRCRASTRKRAFAWIDGMPMYAKFGWGLGVWLGLLGAVLLLMRSRWAVWSLGLSFVGAVLGLGWQIALAPPSRAPTAR